MGNVVKSLEKINFSRMNIIDGTIQAIVQIGNRSDKQLKREIGRLKDGIYNILHQ